MMDLGLVSLLFLAQLASATDQDLSVVENLLKLSIGVFSLLLLALSASAYRRTGMKRLIFAAVAFGLFAVQLFLDYIFDSFTSFGTLYDAVIFPGTTLAILVLFFLAIVSRK
jgi:hypothetical protein